MRGRVRPTLRLALGFVLAGAATGLGGCGRAGAPTGSPLGGPVRQGFHAEVPFSPAVQRLPDRTRLVYELHLTSFASAPITLRRVEVLDAESGRAIAELAADALGAAAVEAWGPPGRPMAGPVEPGRRVIVYLEIEVGSVPRRVRHRIHFDAGGPGDARAFIEAAEAGVRPRSAGRLGPPLRGGPWVAVYHPRLERGHRRVVYAIDGRARIPGRFAVDWMRPSGAAGAGSTASGAEVLAVADAVVAAVRDGVPEPEAGQRPGAVPLGDATGNFIALDLGDGAYAFYEHLRPGILVGPGDRVRRGQVIGAVGSTGQAPVPHLHFHVSDGLSPLGAEGLPFTLTEIEALGAYASIDAFFDGAPWHGDDDAGRGGPRPPFFPSPMMVVRFPEGAPPP